MEEITAVFCEERHRWDQTIVGAAQMDVDGETVGISIKGTADLDELHRSATYRFYGKWTNYTNRRTGREERQFVFSTFCLAQPAGREGIIAYLRRAGEGNGIGTARATRLWEIYGSETVRMLREQPAECAAKVKGLSQDKAESAARWLVAMQKLEACTIELTDILAGRGFPQSVVKQAIGKWGNEAARRIRKNPYVLMEFPRCGFKLTDHLWLALGLPPGRLLRQALAAWYAVAADNEGYTWYPAKFAIQGIRNVVRGVDLQEIKALKLAFRIGRRTPDTFGALEKLRTDDSGAIVESGGQVWVAEGRNARNEMDVARMVSAASRESHQWPSPWTIDGITSHQAGELDKALRGTIAILGGSPGTGKTYTAACLLKQMIKQLGAGKVAVAAPTGKAAVRIAETMHNYGVPGGARTWHSLLGIGKHSESGTWSFEAGEDNPFPYKLLVGDESSMVDLSLMTAILKARAAGTHVLLIGDVNQLPPVGDGAPLRDMIRAGLPYGELREIKRNSGGIVEACAAIRDGERWAAGDNLEIWDSRGPDHSIELLLKAVGSERSGDIDRVWDIQPLVATNEKGELNRKRLNEILQHELNPNPGISGQTFREGDKIVNTKNITFPTVDEYQQETGKTYVANGELAEALEVHPSKIIARLQSPQRTILIPKSKDSDNGTGCTWELGYALSVHKSQGSDWHTAVVLLDESGSAKMVCDRAWLYTAISRAKQRCILIGKKATADRFCRTQKMDKRKTFLAEQILRLSAQRTLVEL